MVKMKEKLIFRNIFLTAERMSTVGVLVAHRNPGMCCHTLARMDGHRWSHVPSVGTIQIVIALSAYLRVRGWLNQTQRSARQKIACDTSPLLTMNVCPEGPD